MDFLVSMSVMGTYLDMILVTIRLMIKMIPRRWSVITKIVGNKCNEVAEVQAEFMFLEEVRTLKWEQDISTEDIVTWRQMEEDGRYKKLLF